jgi:hypothetical protein
LRLRWCLMAWTAKRRLKPAAWTVRPCETGCTVTTPRDWPGFAISNRQVPDQNSRRGSWPNWPSLSSRPRPRGARGSCVGGGSICATNCSGASVLGYLRGNKLAITVFDDYDDIVDKACGASNFFEQDPKRIASRTFDRPPPRSPGKAGSVPAVRPGR